jgi:murein DD-endopeptidase MepM/ murein hydrolase activator NlpD
VGAWPWLVGGGALAAYAITRSRAAQRADASHSRVIESSQPTTQTPTSLPGHWVWPVPRWNGRAPVISDGFFSPRPGAIRHGGVDLMFARVSTDAFKVGPNGSAHHVMPDGMTAVAASDGVVWSAGMTPRGFTVVLDHGPRQVATYHTHLEKLLVHERAGAKGGEAIRAGQPIGVIGADPMDREHLKHLHFEIWLPDHDHAIDPAPLMRGWESVLDPNALVARNASLVYRAVGESGDAYPDWVRALKGKAGVYVIRDLDSREIVYVGSSAGRLYDTLTRHFQMWRRYKGFWRGQYGEGHDPGLTYERNSVEVAVRLTSPTRSLEEEMRLIGRLRPRDNLIGQRSLTEEVPF